MKIALVTGAAGFIGRHVCERLLKETWKVYGIDNFLSGQVSNIEELNKHYNFIFLNIDIAKQFSFDFKVDEIWHLACPASPPFYQKDPIHTTKTCVIGTLQLLEIARTHNAKMIFTSTSEIYGDPAITPQPESYNGNVNPLGPRACYDEGKRCAETLCSDYKRIYNLDIRIVRLFNTYGPYMRLDDGRVITNFIRQILTNHSLTVYGTGSQTRSFCYIDDTVEALFLVMSCETYPDVINIGNPNEEITILKLAEKMSTIRKNVEIEFRELPVDDPKRRCPNIERLEKLHWSPKISLMNGLRMTLEYYEGHCKSL